MPAFGLPLFPPKFAEQALTGGAPIGVRQPVCVCPTVCVHPHVCVCQPVYTFVQCAGGQTCSQTALYIKLFLRSIDQIYLV